MFIDNKNIPAFKVFCKGIGISDYSERTGQSYQPDARWNWRNKVFWAYETNQGLDVFGEDSKEFEKNWNAFTKMLLEKQEKEKNERENRPDTDSEIQSP